MTPIEALNLPVTIPDDRDTLERAVRVAIWTRHEDLMFAARHGGDLLGAYLALQSFATCGFIDGDIVAAWLSEAEAIARARMIGDSQ